MQVGSDIREGRDRDGEMGVTSHCLGWLWFQLLKNSCCQTTGIKNVHFGAFVVIGALQLCPEFFLRKWICWCMFIRPVKKTEF